MVTRRKALAAAGVFLVNAACNREKLFGPCARESEAPADILPLPELRDVYVVDGFTGLQLGTKDNPYSVRTAAEFDGLHSFLSADDYLAVHWQGRFATKGAYRWSGVTNWLAGKHWTIDGIFELAIDPTAIPDSEIQAQPLYVIASKSGTPRITGGTLIGSHSALADRFRAKGKSLRTGAVLFYGRGKIDGMTWRNFGSLGAESFIAEIVGSGSITNTVFTDFDPSASDDQVTVRRIMGSENGEAITSDECLQEGNETFVTGENKVQAHTIYWAERGVVRNNRSRGANVGCYGDWGVTKGLEFDGNDFEGCEHGFQFKLSPVPLPIADQFSHADYRIGVNRVVSRGANVSLDTVGPPTSTRFIKGIQVDPGLSVEAFGAEWSRPLCRAAA